jgi:HAD superfamily hydrolase (TIGR01549 family)
MSARPVPDVVVLDVGEVLIDETRLFTLWADVLGVSGGTLLAVLGAAIAQGEDHRAAFPHVAPNLDWVALEDEHEARYGGFRDEDLYPDVRDALRSLRAAGFRVVLAGNQPRRRAEQLRALALEVDDLVTSEELGAEKPDPAFFAAVLDRLGLTRDEAARVLYVGDRVDNDVLPAIEAGMATCWLRRGPWGQLHDLPDDVAPDLVLDGLGELPQLLVDWRDGADDEGPDGADDRTGAA